MAKITATITARAACCILPGVKLTFGRQQRGARAVPVQPAPSARTVQERKVKRTRKANAKPIATAADQRTRDRDAVRGTQRLPVLDDAMANNVAKLLMSGVPFLRVLAMCDPSYFAWCESLDEETRDRRLRTWLLSWQRDPALLRANSALNGAEWQDLEPDRRLQIAIDKHMAELAFFLYTHNYDALIGKDVDKADNARGAILEFLTAKNLDPDAPWMKHLKDLVDKVGADAVPMLTAPVTNDKGKDIRS